MGIQEEMEIDIKNYYKGMRENNISLCIAIEKRYGLYGYPPNIVCSALQAEVHGDGMDSYFKSMGL